MFVVIYVFLRYFFFNLIFIIKQILSWKWKSQPSKYLKVLYIDTRFKFKRETLRVNLNGWFIKKKKNELRLNNENNSE